MKKAITAFMCLLSVLSVTLGVLWGVSATQNSKHEMAFYERAYTQASEACEGLALSLFAANKSFLASDIASVRERASIFSIKLAELSLDEVRCASLHRYISIVDEIAEGALRLLDLGETSEYYQNLFGTFAPYAKRLEDEFLPTLEAGADYEVLDEIFADLGGIYYEGVYSDEEREGLFSLLKSAPILHEEEVMGTVKNLLGENVKLKSSFSQSFPPFFSFYCENASLDISQMGGYVLRFLYDRRPADTECSPEQAKERMNDFLEMLGFEELRIVGFSDEGDYIAVFAPVVNSNVGDILCLSERIKVCVGRDSGRVTAYDATDYYKYHCKKREVSEIAVPNGGTLVYIIASDGRETLCYESDGEYYNVENGGREIKIY